MKKIAFITFLFVSQFSFGQSIERDVIGALGGTSIQPEIQVDFTVGETAIFTFEQSGIMITQGFMQAENSSGVGIENQKNEGVSLFPNPFSDRLYMDAEYSSSVTIVNVLGELIYSGPIGLNGINTENLVPGLYFITIGGNTFKCIKGSR